jgi:uncharacterized membrane protein
MTVTQKYFLGAAAVIAATLAGTMVAYPQLPSVIPIHWGAHGEVNGWGPKWSLFVLGPGLMTFLVLVFAALPYLSPQKFEVDSFRATYLYIMAAVIALMAYVHLLILLNDLGSKINMTKSVLGGVCLLIVLLGNVMGKVRRNFFVGIRTPWTIANEQVWNATHRFAAKTMFAGGVAALVLTLAGGPIWFPIVAIAASTVAPVVYSFIFYKNLERHGSL